MRKQLIIVSYLCFLSACASSDSAPGDPYAEPPTRGSDCISQMTVRDYSVLDNQNLIVGAGGKRRYHVELSRLAFGLSSTWQIGFDSRTGRICPGFSSLLINDGMGVDKVAIRSVRRLDDQRHEELLIRFGKHEQATTENPAPREVEGAEVEELD